MTPETEVSSTVATNSNNSNDSDQSDEAYSVKIEPSVIPHTTIVCMPNMVTAPSQQQQQQQLLQSSSYSNSSSMSPSGFQQQKLTQNQFQSSQFQYADIDTASTKANTNRILSQPIQFSQSNQIAQALQHRHQVITEQNIMEL